ncbi:hypothetical protein [Streptomyces albipurpureus]|uniref:Ig-like domain-containing protein n=1 Tax=Streptomyces albipurpureus TaxID=2897419 RepID=A0ABT0UEK2_9ACTN|nr:hypothetical protein [Streptomyces sp. CWNU-1]MCM2386983.1 hypothetical protein [Streptomyces sp. CWNU-1]
MNLTFRPRLVAVLACTALAALGIAAPSAAAAPQSAQVTKSLELQWASASPAWFPFSGTLTIGGTYTCTAPAGTTVNVTFSALQIMPTAMPSGWAALPCGPGVIDAPWEATSYPDSQVHHGYTSVFATFDGVGLPPQQFDA